MVTEAGTNFDKTLRKVERELEEAARNNPHDPTERQLGQYRAEPLDEQKRRGELYETIWPDAYYLRGVDREKDSSPRLIYHPPTDEQND